MFNCSRSQAGRIDLTAPTRDVLQKALSEINSGDSSVVFSAQSTCVIEPGEGSSFKGSGEWNFHFGFSVRHKNEKL